MERIVVLLDDTDAICPICCPESRRSCRSFDGEFETRRWDELAGFYEAVVALYTGIFAVFAGHRGGGGDVLGRQHHDDGGVRAHRERSGRCARSARAGPPWSPCSWPKVRLGRPARRGARGGGVVADRRGSGVGRGHRDAAASRDDPGLPGLLQPHGRGAAGCLRGHRGRYAGLRRSTPRTQRHGSESWRHCSNDDDVDPRSLSLRRRSSGSPWAPARHRRSEPTLLQRVDSARAPDRAFAFKVAVTTPDGDAFRLSVRVSDRVKSLVRYLEAAPQRRAFAPVRRAQHVDLHSRHPSGPENLAAATDAGRSGERRPRPHGLFARLCPRLRGGDVRRSGRRASPAPSPVRPLERCGLWSDCTCRRRATTRDRSGRLYFGIPPVTIISRPRTSKATERCWDGRDRPSCG